MNEFVKCILGTCSNQKCFSVNEFVKSITPELGGILPVQLLNCIHENVYAVSAAILVAACWHQSNFGLGYWNFFFFF